MVNIQNLPRRVQLLQTEVFNMTTQFRVFKTTKIIKRNAETPWEASHDAFIRRPPPTPAPSRAGSLRPTHHQRHYL
jgi:hypothetical protein